MTSSVSVETTERIQVVDVTDALVANLGDASGLAVFYVDHTTAALLVGAIDRELGRDIARVASGLLAPFRPFEHLQHGKANGEAHILSALAGTQVCLPVAGGDVPLGMWQRLLLLELDGPQRRTLHVQVLATGGRQS